MLMHKTYDWHLLEFIELTVGGSKIIIIIIHLLFASSSFFFMLLLLSFIFGMCCWCYWNTKVLEQQPRVTQKRCKAKNLNFYTLHLLERKPKQNLRKWESIKDHNSWLNFINLI